MRIRARAHLSEKLLDIVRAQLATVGLVNVTEKDLTLVRHAAAQRIHRMRVVYRLAHRDEPSEG